MTHQQMASFSRRDWISTMMLAGFSAGLKKGASASSPTATAKRIIFLNMTGGTSQIDLWDHKPDLHKYEGQALPPSVVGEKDRFANVNAQSTVMASPYKFQPHGSMATQVSELLPYTAKMSDELCLIHSMQCDEINHPAAQLLWQTGFPRSGRPSVGAWLNYAFGDQGSDLPGFVFLQSGEGPECGDDCTSSGFLPRRFRGLRIQGGKTAMDYLSNPAGISDAVRSQSLKTAAKLDQLSHAGGAKDTYSNAFAQALDLQHSIPELVDISKEPAETLRLYGIDRSQPSFAVHCLMARRLAERGVRFIQLNHGDWDFHSDLHRRLPQRCAETDQGAAALIQDLRRCGMLDETLVVWGSEFGRTPMRQKGTGRDHHRTFTIWIAGGGIKAGLRYGSTDDFGYQCRSKPTPVHDLQATLLNLMGINHRTLTFRHQGRDFRLTDVGGNVVHDWIA